MISDHDYESERLRWPCRAAQQLLYHISKCLPDPAIAATKESYSLFAAKVAGLGSRKSPRSISACSSSNKGYKTQIKSRMSTVLLKTDGVKYRAIDQSQFYSITRYTVCHHSLTNGHASRQCVDQRWLAVLERW
jgi:hypothetical protein